MKGLESKLPKFTEMPHVGSESSQFSPVFRIDVSAEPTASGTGTPSNVAEATVALLHQVVAAQHKQNQLLEQLIQATVSVQKQRNTELQQWKDANPALARSCRRAAEKLSKVQTEFLETLTEEIDDQEEHLSEGDYMLNEFVDRFGPRLAHLNGVLQVLAQLGSNAPSHP
jgi:exonuclease VII large subunit